MTDHEATRETRWPGRSPRPTGREGRAVTGVGGAHSVRRAAACSGGLKSHWRSDGERHIQERGVLGSLASASEVDEGRLSSEYGDDMDQFEYGKTPLSAPEETDGPTEP